MGEGDTAGRSGKHTDFPLSENRGSQAFEITRCECERRIELNTDGNGQLIEYEVGTRRLHKCNRTVPKRVVRKGRTGMRSLLRDIY